MDWRTLDDYYTDIILEKAFKENKWVRHTRQRQRLIQECLPSVLRSAPLWLVTFYSKLTGFHIQEKKDEYGVWLIIRDRKNILGKQLFNDTEAI